MLKAARISTFAVVLLGLSLTRHLRRANDNADAGAFGPVDEDRQQLS